jgi:hypothetical protein
VRLNLSHDSAVDQPSLYFGNIREPYCLNVAGVKWYILTDGEDVTATYRINEGSLSYDIFAIEVMRMLGVTEDGIKRSFEPSDPGECSLSLPKTLSTVFRESSRAQLYPGRRYEEVLLPALRCIAEDLNHVVKASQVSGSNHTHIMLYDYISRLFVGFGQEIYFGKALANLEPQTVASFIEFDSLSWQVLYQYPTFMCRKMRAAKNRVQDALERYLDLPSETRVDAAWVTKVMEDGVRECGLSKRDTAIVFFQLYWR